MEQNFPIRTYSAVTCSEEVPIENDFFKKLTLPTSDWLEMGELTARPKIN